MAGFSLLGVGLVVVSRALGNRVRGSRDVAPDDVGGQVRVATADDPDGTADGPGAPNDDATTTTDDPATTDDSATPADD